MAVTQTVLRHRPIKTLEEFNRVYRFMGVKNLKRVIAASRAAERARRRRELYNLAATGVGTVAALKLLTKILETVNKKRSNLPKLMAGMGGAAAAGATSGYLLSHRKTNK